MADGYVQVPQDGAGKRIDNSELVREPILAPDGTQSTAALTVERQRTVIGSDENPRLQVEVKGAVGRGSLAVSGASLDILRSIDRSLKMLLVILATELEQDLDSVGEIVDINNERQ